MAADWTKAKNEAKKVLKRYGLSRPPIDPEAIAEAMGVDVVYTSFSGEAKQQISGFIQFEPLRIVVNKEIHPNRMTFTIAHELAHFIMHKEYAKSQAYQVMPRRNEYRSGKPKEEQEADCFAAELLVPSDMLKTYRSVASTRELARLFAVSEDVILNRLNRVGSEG